MKNNQVVSYALGILFSFCLIVTLLITSVEAVTYWTPGYYEREYSKYNVTEDVHMEMDDLLDVTTEMMAYLRGNREDLHVPTIVDGQPREFFNDREIAHMEDVRGLFVGALVLRRICIVTAFVCVALLWLLKADIALVVPRSVCWGTGLFFAIICVLGLVISTDFTKYFVIFHHIFFNNDLWLLDPATDLLINIVPEPFLWIRLLILLWCSASAWRSSSEYHAGGCAGRSARESRQMAPVRQTHRISVFCLQNHFYDNGDF